MQSTGYRLQGYELAKKAVIQFLETFKETADAADRYCGGL